jgi:hypothetical protein
MERVKKRGIHLEFSTPAQQLLGEGMAGRLNQYVGTDGSFRWTKILQLDGN